VTGGDIVQHIADLKTEKDMTVIVATHDPVVASTCERVVTMRDGRLLNDMKIPATQAKTSRTRFGGSVGLTEAGEARLSRGSVAGLETGTLADARDVGPDLQGVRMAADVRRRQRRQGEGMTSASAQWWLVVGSILVPTGAGMLILYRYRIARHEEGAPLSWGQNPPSRLELGRRSWAESSWSSLGSRRAGNDLQAVRVAADVRRKVGSLIVCTDWPRHGTL
jgi:hypothetical protein